MTDFDYMIKKVNCDDLKSNYIYWFGTDTSGRKKYCALEKTWLGVYNYLYDKGVIGDTEELENLDDKDKVLQSRGNAYYQYYIETDEYGEVIDKGGDIKWFPIIED